MRTGFAVVAFAIVTSVTFGARTVEAESPPLNSPPQPVSQSAISPAQNQAGEQLGDKANAPQAPTPVLLEPAAPTILAPAPRAILYGNLDYLLWWVKGAPLSVPLVTTGPIETTHHGFVNSPDATILYGAPFAPAQGGNDTQSFGAFSGLRLNLGFWLDSDRRFAIEGSAFLLGRRTAGYAARADENGMPILNTPVHNNVVYTAGRGTSPSENEDGLPYSLPSDEQRADGNAGVFTGGVKITNSLRLWGADVAGVLNLNRGNSWELSALAGFRYLDLFESFDLNGDIQGVSGSYASNSGNVFDHFQTRNQFYGCTLGLRGRYVSGFLTFDLMARIALGATHQVININGGFESFNRQAPYLSGPEGIFAQPANSGRTADDDFAVLPEVQCRASYALTNWLSVSVGYDFLFLSRVVRPGDQINRNIPKGQTFLQGGDDISATSPARFFNRTDFYAHGLTFGLDWRY
jgi:hypothetical protein